MRQQEREAVIVDVDGTLCDVTGIRHYVLADRRRRDYESFHKASAICHPIPTTVAWVDEQREAGRAVIVVTARKARWEYLTRRWLRKWGIAFNELHMRADDDRRRDDAVKADILANIRSRGYRVVGAIDDNPNVIALWEREGIPVTIVPGWQDDIAAA